MTYERFVMVIIHDFPAGWASHATVDSMTQKKLLNEICKCQLGLIWQTNSKHSDM